MALESNFPRGGKKTRLEKSVVHPTEENEDLFKILKKDSKTARKSKKKQKSTTKPDESVTEETVVIENLTSKTLLVDMLVLGCLRDVGDYGLSIALPGGLIGKLPVTNISDKYTEVLQQYSEDPESSQNQLSTLTSMYEVGTCLPMRVITHITDPTTTKFSTTLSIKPKDVNKDISPNSVYHGMLLLSSVESVEDHGYVMDVGIGKLKGFLKKSECLQVSSLSLGQTVMCCVNMPNLDSSNTSSHRVLTLSMKKKLLSNIMDMDETHISLNSLLPCSQVKCMIVETKGNGLIVKCSQYSACVHRDHLKNVFDLSSNYEIGKTVVGTVLYLHPVTNTLHLSISPKLTSSNFRTIFYDVKFGDIIEEATVINVTASRVYFKLNDKVKGLAKIKHLGEIHENIDNASELFNIGDKHRCRILGFNYVDRVALVSMKRNIFQQFLIDKNDIEVGSVFSGVVDHHVTKGIKVKLGQGTFGLLPYRHLADQEIINPERQFPPGKKIQCRVLRVDRVGNYVSPLLTCKQTLVSSKLAPLSSYEQAEVNGVYHGYVIKVNSSGVVVAFYNDVKGWVPVQELSSEYIQYPEKIFYVGQVVRARVLNSKPEEQKMYLSLKLENRKHFGVKDLTADKKLKPGHVISVQVVGKSTDGLDVLTLPDGLKGFLPVNHLSDFPRLCKLFFELYDVSDIISNVLCFSTKGTIMLSKKRILSEAADSGNFISSWKCIQPGQILPGVVKAFLSYGIFLELGSGISGLVHKKNLVDGNVIEPTRVGFVTHQSVMAKVLDVHLDTRRMSLSTRLSDVSGYPLDDEDSVKWLDNYLKDWKEIGSLHGKKGVSNDMSALKIGGILQVTVKSVTPNGLLCVTDKGVEGIITKQNMGEIQPEVNMDVCAMVLHLDWKNNFVELSICPQLIKQRESRKGSGKKKHDHLLGQSFHGTVLMIRTHFALTALHEPAEGVLAYVPLFRHANDLVGISYKTGDVIQLSVKKACKRFLICSKVSYEMPAVKERVRKRKHEKVFSNASDDKGIPEGLVKKNKKVKIMKSAHSGDVSDSDNQDRMDTDISPSSYKLDDCPVQSGVVANFNNKFFFVKLDSGACGVISKSSIAEKLIELLVVGTKIKVKVSGKRDSFSSLQLLNIDEAPQKDDVVITTPVLKHHFGRKDNQDSGESESEDLQSVVAKIGLSKYSVPITSVAEERTSLDCLTVEGSLRWDVEATPNLNLIEQNQIENNDSSDNESGAEDANKNSAPKAKLKKLKEEEEYLVKQEQRLMDPSREPETVDDFDRLVLAQPDNSVVWLKYMSFHLQQAEVDKARAVAQKALSTISFREEQEKLNIWFALLNLENLYGTNETLEGTFQKAIQFNEPFKVYTHLANIYMQSEKNQEAEKLYAVMLKKFKGQPQIWLDYTLHCLKTGKSLKANDLFQQCLKSLEKRHHVEVVTKFAHMEFKYGEAERGKTMMESLLASYPRRTDLWSQYADLLLKYGDIQGTRQVLERSICTKLSAKKMKFLFKKYMDFEKQHGNEELIEKLKQRALEYVQSTPDV